MSGNRNPKYRTDGLGLYIHVPFCRTKCRYCNFYSIPIADYDPGEIVCAMVAEMERYKLGRSVKTVYIGGGSPSCLPAEHLLRLAGEAAKRCPMAEEFTIEVNPGQVDKTLLCELRKAGANRLSIGAQSFIPRELDFLGRSHTADCIGKAVQQGRAAGFDNISLDLIFAVPGSCLNSWKHNLDSAIELKVEHISAYALTYENDTPLGKDLAAGLVQQVDEDTDRAMYEMAIDELAKAGLEQYEISNFASPGFECRHNLNYWANGSYIGIGPGATSYLQGTRSITYANISSYVEAISGGENTVATSETLGDLERACETAVLNLRRRHGIDLAEFKSRTGFDALKLFAGPILTYQERGFIKNQDGRIFLTREALGIADSILCDFAAV
jgi:oxygen-independent coproporphyrinogen-3 oxidase